MGGRSDWGGVLKTSMKLEIPYGNNRKHILKCWMFLCIHCNVSFPGGRLFFYKHMEVTCDNKYFKCTVTILMMTMVCVSFIPGSNPPSSWYLLFRFSHFPYLFTNLPPKRVFFRPEYRQSIGLTETNPNLFGMVAPFPRRCSTRWWFQTFSPPKFNT